MPKLSIIHDILQRKIGNEELLTHLTRFKESDQWRDQVLLNDANLANLSLANLELQGVQFGSANLSGTKFWSCDMSGSIFEEADLRRVSFNYCDLSRAVINSCNLSNAVFNGCTFKHAVLVGSDFTYAKFDTTDFTGTLMNNVIFKESSFASVSLSDLDLSTVIGLDKVLHLRPSSIGIDTIFRSKGKIPDIFLRGCGIPEVLIDYHRSMIGQAIDLYSCFISYSSADGSFAQRLHDTLQGQGIRCWFDKKDLLPGNDLHQEIDRGIKVWDKFLLCCSRTSLTDRWWVDAEINKALQKEQHIQRESGERVQILVPLDLDGFVFSDECNSPYKSEITRRVAARYNGWEHDNNLFTSETERLIRALRTNGGKNPPPSPKV